jgi:hypothetical protein
LTFRWRLSREGRAPRRTNDQPQGLSFVAQGDEDVAADYSQLAKPETDWMCKRLWHTRQQR